MSDTGEYESPKLVICAFPILDLLIDPVEQGLPVVRAFREALTGKPDPVPPGKRGAAWPPPTGRDGG